MVTATNEEFHRRNVPVKDPGPKQWKELGKYETITQEKLINEEYHPLLQLSAQIAPDEVEGLIFFADSIKLPWNETPKDDWMYAKLSAGIPKEYAIGKTGDTGVRYSFSIHRELTEGVRVRRYGNGESEYGIPISEAMEVGTYCNLEL